MFERRGNKFYLNDNEFIIHSGALHYFRTLPEYWEDLLIKFKAAGLNCVETYTCWNLHEPHKGEYDFTGRLDLIKFLQTADKVGLKVILRTGPFICAEFENGGLPAWLLKKEYSIKIRCNVEPYITHVRDWFNVILPMVKPYLDSNGGPIIALAVENEYGSFGDDFTYLAEIEKMYKDHQMDCLYIAADGWPRFNLSTGKHGEDVVHGLDFGGFGDMERFNIINEMEPNSPPFVTEFWAGAFTTWDKSCFQIIGNDKVQTAMKNFVDNKVNFNIYMMFGGTNFGFTNGADGKCAWFPQEYTVTTTSYDYDAPISEWGGYTERYFDIRNALIKGGADCPEPPASPVLQNIGTVNMTMSASLFDNMHIGKHFKSVTPDNMEEYDQNNGYILYSKTIEYDAAVDRIIIKGIHDRALVYINKEFIGIGYRADKECTFKYHRNLKPGDVIDVLVENMGRINYGEETYLGDRKGITEGILVTYEQDGIVRRPAKWMFNWDVTTFEMDNVDKVNFECGICDNFPAFFKGNFSAEKNKSCFVHFDNFTKGVIYINGFNIGRYWNNGPITALYIPGALLKEENEIIIFESDGLKGEPNVSITTDCGLQGHHKEVIVE